MERSKAISFSITDKILRVFQAFVLLSHGGLTFFYSVAFCGLRARAPLSLPSFITAAPRFRSRHRT